MTIIDLGGGDDEIVVGTVPLIPDPGNRTLEFPDGVPVADTENMTNGNSAPLFVLGDGKNDRFEVNHNRAKLSSTAAPATTASCSRRSSSCARTRTTRGDHEPGEPVRRHRHEPLRLPAERAGVHQRRPGHRHDRRRRHADRRHLHRHRRLHRRRRPDRRRSRTSRRSRSTAPAAPTRSTCSRTGDELRDDRHRRLGRRHDPPRRRRRRRWSSTRRRSPTRRRRSWSRCRRSSSTTPIPLNLDGFTFRVNLVRLARPRRPLIPNGQTGDPVAEAAGMAVAAAASSRARAQRFALPRLVEARRADRRRHHRAPRATTSSSASCSTRRSRSRSATLQLTLPDRPPRGALAADPAARRRPSTRCRSRSRPPQPRRREDPQPADDPRRRPVRGRAPATASSSTTRRAGPRPAALRPPDGAAEAERRDRRRPAVHADLDSQGRQQFDEFLTFQGAGLGINAGSVSTDGTQYDGIEMAGIEHLDIRLADGNGHRRERRARRLRRGLDDAGPEPRDLGRRRRRRRTDQRHGRRHAGDRRRSATTSSRCARSPTASTTTATA